MEPSALRSLADNGNPSAQHDYARWMLSHGGDKSQAFRYFQKAALNNHTAALFQCGRMFQNGEGVAANESKALAFFERAEQNGCAEASLELGKLLLSRGGSGDVERSRELFERASASHLGEAFFFLGHILEHGLLSPPDAQAAQSLYERGASLGDLSCCRSLGVLLCLHRESESSLCRAAELLFRSLPLGDPASSYYLGGLLNEGRYFPFTKRSGWSYIEESANSGFLPACLSLGIRLCAEGGEDTVADELKSETKGDAEERSQEDELESEVLKASVVDASMAEGQPSERPDGNGSEEEDLKADSQKEDREKESVQERKERGVAYLRRSLPLDSPECHYQLAHALLSTFPFSQESQEEAIFHYRRSVESHHLPSLRELGSFLVQSDRDAQEGELLLSQAAQEGDAAACLEYGAMIYEGHAAERDLSVARRLFRVTADAGSDQGCLNYAIVCARGEGGPTDYESSASYFQRAVDLGSHAARYSLALLLQEGVLGPPDHSRVLLLLQGGSESGDLSCRFHLAQFYERESPYRDLSLARSIYKTCADAGFVEGIEEYARMCLRGEGGPVSLRESREYYLKGSILGDATCMYCLARFYEKSGVASDEQEARILYESLAAQGHTKGTFRLARMEEGGLGGDRDLLSALEHYEQAGEKGHAAALYRAALIYSEVNPSSEPTHEMFQRACDLGYGPALYDYGLLLLRMPGDRSLQGRSLLQEAESRGVASASYALGVAMEEGLGGPDDARRARQCYRRSADQGDLRGLYSYGLMVLDGRGGDRDVSEAWACLKRAALGGNEFASSKVLDLYSQGKGGLLSEEEERTLRLIVDGEDAEGEGGGSWLSWCAIA